MVDLGLLGGTHSGAYGINNAGQVVGSAITATLSGARGPVERSVAGSHCQFRPRRGPVGAASDGVVAGARSRPKAMVSGDFDGNGLDNMVMDFAPPSGSGSG